MKTFRVHVTQQDIDNGRRKDEARCPVGLALRRETGERFFVGMNTAQGMGYESCLPLSVQKFNESFDSGRAVKPFAFRFVLGLEPK